MAGAARLELAFAPWDAPRVKDALKNGRGGKT